MEGCREDRRVSAMAMAMAMGKPGTPSGGVAPPSFLPWRRATGRVVLRRAQWKPERRCVSWSRCFFVLRFSVVMIHCSGEVEVGRGGRGRIRGRWSPSGVAHPLVLRRPSKTPVDAARRGLVGFPRDAPCSPGVPRLVGPSALSWGVLWCRWLVLLRCPSRHPPSGSLVRSILGPFRVPSHGPRGGSLSLSSSSEGPSPPCRRRQCMTSQRRLGRFVVVWLQDLCVFPLRAGPRIRGGREASLTAAMVVWWGGGGIGRWGTLSLQITTVLLPNLDDRVRYLIMETFVV